MSFVIFHHTDCEGAVPFEKDADGNPVAYGTADEAQVALDGFFEDVEAEIMSGERAREDGYDEDDFWVGPHEPGAAPVMPTI